MALPDLVVFEGDWDAYLDRLYVVYIAEIVQADLRFQGCPVNCRYRPPTEGKGYGFWHCIQEGRTEDERLPDLRRCERLRWIPWMIRNAGIDSRISFWKEKRGADIDVVLWAESEEYVVILSQRRDYYLLKTAYVANKSHKVESLRRNRERYQDRKKD